MVRPSTAGRNPGELQVATSNNMLNVNLGHICSASLPVASLCFLEHARLQVRALHPGHRYLACAAAHTSQAPHAPLPPARRPQVSPDQPPASQTRAGIPAGAEAALVLAAWPLSVSPSAMAAARPACGRPGAPAARLRPTTPPCRRAPGRCQGLPPLLRCCRGPRLRQKNYFRPGRKKYFRPSALPV